MLLHASCVALGDRAVLLAGPSGCGKSDLALRLLDEGAELVADDQTRLACAGEGLVASPPAALAGLIEVRHIGLFRLPFRREVPVALYVELTPPEALRERLPEEAPIFLLDQPVRRLRLPGLAASTPAKIRLALRAPVVES